MQPRVRWWPKPALADIVWCRFPRDLGVAIKPRPALIIRIMEDESQRIHVRVAYGTSQKPRDLFAGEFSILADRDAQAYELAGLSYDTKFNLKDSVDLPFNDEWFEVAPGAPHGRSPKLGTLHMSKMRALRAAAAALSENK
jgi:hypothetical protein